MLSATVSATCRCWSASATPWRSTPTAGCGRWPSHSAGAPSNGASADGTDRAKTSLIVTWRLFRRFIRRRLSAFDRLPHVFGTTRPGRLVGRFEWYRNVIVRIQVGRHVRQRVANPDRLDVSDFRNGGDVSGQRERLVRRKFKRLLLDLVPNDLVDPLGVAGGRRKQIDDEDINTLPEKLDRLLDERPQGGTAPLVSRGDDFYDTDYAAQRMTDRDTVAAGRRDFLLRAEDVSGLRRRGDDDPAHGFGRRDGPWPALQGDHIGHDAAGMLLDQRRESLGKQAAVQSVTDGDRPGLMEVVKQVGINGGPVVNRHNVSLLRTANTPPMPIIPAWL